MRGRSEGIEATTTQRFSSTIAHNAAGVSLTARNWSQLRLPQSSDFKVCLTCWIEAGFSLREDKLPQPHTRDHGDTGNTISDSP